MASVARQEARQRWRLTIARDDRSAGLDERRFTDALVAGFAAAGLPIATTGGARPRARVGLAAALPRGATADADLVELYLGERLSVDVVRHAVAAGLPEGVRLVALEDEWIGAPSLASRVAAVVYRVDVDAGGPAPAPEPSIGGRVRVIEWDDATGRGTLAVRFERESTGRLGRPAEPIGALGAGLRVVRISRVSVELIGE